MNLAFSVIAMEWFDKISEFMEGLPEWLQAHPRYGYLIVAGILLLWLVGIVCGWLLWVLWSGAVDVLPSGKLGREFLAGYAG